MSAVPESGVAPATNSFRRVGGRATRNATIIAFFAWLFAVFDFIMFGTLLPQISASFGWDNATASLVSTLVSVGTAVVALAVGPITDRIGRRKGMILTVSGTAVASALSSVTPSAAYLIGVRALGGLGLCRAGGQRHLSHRDLRGHRRREDQAASRPDLQSRAGRLPPRCAPGLCVGRDLPAGDRLAGLFLARGVPRRGHRPDAAGAVREPAVRAGAADCAHCASGAGPPRPRELARSYGVDERPPPRWRRSSRAGRCATRWCSVQRGSSTRLACSCSPCWAPRCSPRAST